MNLSPTDQTLQPTHKMSNPISALSLGPANCVRKWFKEMGDRRLPCAHVYRKSQLEMKGKKLATWTNTLNNETVDIEPVMLRTFYPQDTSGLSVLIATGKKTGRCLLDHHSIGKVGSWYAVWEWPRYRSSNGLAPYPWFVKHAVDVSAAHARSVDRASDVFQSSSAGTGLEKVKPTSSSDLTPRRSSRPHREKHAPKRYSDETSKVATVPKASPGRPSEDDQVQNATQASALLDKFVGSIPRSRASATTLVDGSSEVSRSATMGQRSSTKQVVRGAKQSTELRTADAEAAPTLDVDDACLETRVTVIFAPHLVGPTAHLVQPGPRVRLWSLCNSSSKLFAQARAGSVFGGSTSVPGARVLSARIGYGEQKELILVEGDEEDFESLVTELKSCGAWYSVDGERDAKQSGIRGSCTLEVTALE